MFSKYHEDVIYVHYTVCEYTGFWHSEASQWMCKDIGYRVLCCHVQCSYSGKLIMTSPATASISQLCVALSSIFRGKMSQHNQDFGLWKNMAFTTPNTSLLTWTNSIGLIYEIRTWEIDICNASNLWEVEYFEIMLWSSIFFSIWLNLPFWWLDWYSFFAQTTLEKYNRFSVKTSPLRYFTRAWGGVNLVAQMFFYSGAEQVKCCR